MNESSSLKVLFIASEADPFVKVGGLADVAGSLPRALMKLGTLGLPGSPKIDIRLVIPFHPQLRKAEISPQVAAEFPVHSDAGEVRARVYTFAADGLPVYLVAGEPVDREDRVYSADLEADGFKYVFFSLACLELARRLGWKPDVLHANDWHTASAVYSLALQRTGGGFFSQTSSLLTVHNLPYLGSMTPTALAAFGLPPAADPDLPSWSRHMALPLGLLAADAVVAVSPGYAREILTEEFGSGLSGYLKGHASKIVGILNGLDTKKWNPLEDQDITQHFSSDTIEARAANKAHLQELLGLEINPSIPILAMVTRMDPQKGVDVAVDALRLVKQSDDPASRPFQVILLGTGNPVLENDARRLERAYPETVRTRILFDEPLSHHIYAGADILLMPSRYEPCGLSQMIAMHYGCVPVARATGGLCDTIQDPRDSEHGTGFLFTPVKPEALAEAIERALDVYTQDPAGWRILQRTGMQQDFSWDRSAHAYLLQYDILLGRGIKV